MSFAQPPFSSGTLTPQIPLVTKPAAAAVPPKTIPLGANNCSLPIANNVLAVPNTVADLLAKTFPATVNDVSATIFSALMLVESTVIP